jgi:membrane fusion protein (multidrug efflux system)
VKDVLAVPERAITQAQATRLVLVVNPDNKVEARPVKLGATINGEVVLASGVKAGERVVVDGLMKARPGTEVKPVAPKPTPPPGAPPPAPSEAKKKI